jgi:hypothetical protein
MNGKLWGQHSWWFMAIGAAYIRLSALNIFPLPAAGNTFRPAWLVDLLRHRPLISSPLVGNIW